MADAPLSPRSIPTRERGYAVVAGPGTFLDYTEELTPELMWPLSIQVYDRMRKTDSQVSSVLKAVASPIIRTPWQLDATGVDEKVARFVSDNLGLPIVDDDKPFSAPSRLRGRSRFSWSEHLRMALLMLPYGHSYFEQVYHPPAEDGLYYLRKLGPRLPPTISQINVARDGGLISIEQYGWAGNYSSKVTLPVNRLVAYVLEKEGGNWLGTSILRAAYKNWLLKDRALRTWSLSVDRNGVGVPVYSGAEGEESLEAGLTLATRVRSGDNAGGAVPHSAKLDLKGVDGTLPDIDQFVRYQDEAIARSALGHVLNLGSQGGTQVGSYNLGSVLRDAFHLGLDSIAGVVQHTGNAHIIEDLVDLNFGPTEPAPVLVYDEIGSRQTELDRIREVAGLSSDEQLAEFIRTTSIERQEAPA